MIPTSLLVAFDGSPESVLALNDAADLARATHAQLTIVGVIPLVSQGFGTRMPTGSGLERALAESREALEKERARLASTGLTGVSVQLLEGDPVSAVVGYVHERAIDLIVVGSRGLDALGRFFLGSVSDGILHYANCSVWVVKARPPTRGAPSERT